MTRCLESKESNACLSAAARSAAASGHSLEVLALCGASDESRWRDECVFDAAEGAVKRNGPSVYAISAALCLEAGSFRQNCIDHLVIAQAHHRPPNESWDEVLVRHHRAVSTIKDAWAPLSEAYGDYLVEMYWAESMERTVAGGPRLSSEFLADLPDEARPHLRASMAAHILAVQEVEHGDLDRWAERLKEAMTTGELGGPIRGAMQNERGGLDLWREDESRSEAALLYRTQSTRWVVEHAETDRVLCVLEAAARMETPRLDLLNAGEQDSREIVRATSERLLGELSRR